MFFDRKQRCGQMAPPAVRWCGAVFGKVFLSLGAGSYGYGRESESDHWKYIQSGGHAVLDDRVAYRGIKEINPRHTLMTSLFISCSLYTSFRKFSLF